MMKKVILAVLMVGILITTIFSVMSVNAISPRKVVNIETAEIINHCLATITGRVVNRFGFGESSANVFIYIGEDPKNSTYYKTIFTNRRGYYKMTLLTSEKGITLQIQAVIITVWGDGDKSQWEEVTVFPGEHYEIPDLILSNWPKDRGHYSPLLLRLLERFPNAFPILRQLLGLQ